VGKEEGQDKAGEAGPPGTMSRALAEQRVAKKNASENVKLLANRIALLKMEEKKVSC